MSGIQDGSAEFRIIDLFNRRCGGDDADVVLGIGDDAAITAVPAGQQVVSAVDALVEGTHFLPGADPRSIGHRSLAVNLSDLAAMGAQPRWALLTLALPKVDELWLDEFVSGFADLAGRFNVSLIGGDTVRGSLSLSVTLMGTVSQGQAVLRSGARPGDIVYLTGRPGWAAAGRDIVCGRREFAGEHSDAYRRRFEFPEPRLQAGQLFAPLVSAMIDVSDGVHTDLSRLLRASVAGAELEVPPLGRLHDDFGFESALQFFLGGGEDYELCFTADARHQHQLGEIADGLGLEIHQLGQVVEGADVIWKAHGSLINPTVDFAINEFSHFQD
jgi:thiamine-monophosphate kinase